MPKKTFESAHKANIQFIVQIKNNQRNLLEEVRYDSSVQKTSDEWKDPIMKEHGRIECRKYEVFDVFLESEWREKWPFINQIVRVTRHREIINSKKISKNTIHYYASNTKLSAKEYGKIIREHWYIENKLHYVKDVDFDEDRRTKRVNPLIYSFCIDWAVNILRGIGCKNIKESIYRASLDFPSFMKRLNILM